MMRGTDKRSGELFSYVDLVLRVRTDHPLRVIREVVSTALAALSGDFAGLYSGVGRPSIPPEMLLRAMLLQAFYSIRSERQLIERLEFDLLFRWFVGLGVDEPVWDHSSFSKNGNRPRAVTLGADKGYDAKDLVMELRELNVRPHIAQNSSGRRSAIDRRTTRHPGYATSQLIRKRIEEAFGWIKTVAGLRKTRFRGLARVELAFTFVAAAYNLVRLPRLLAGASP